MVPTNLGYTKYRKSPNIGLIFGRVYIRRGDLTERFLRYKFGGLILGGAYFRNFTVYYSFQ